MSDALGMLAVCHGIQGEVSIYAGDVSGWEEVSRAMVYRYWVLMLRAKTFSNTRFLQGIRSAPNLTNQLSNAGCLLAGFIAADMHDLAESVADVLVGMSTVDGAVAGGGYGSPSTVTHNGQAVENAGDFSASLPKPAGKVEGGADPKVINPHGELPVVKVNSAGAVKGTPEFEILNNPSARAANTRYELDNGNSFTTNSAGQVDELTFTPVDVKVKRDSRQTEAGKQGRDTDVGGHAQACSQGGTCDGYNLFPQDKNFNASAYRKFYENVIKKALDDPNQIVGPITIKFVRSSPDSPRPDMLRVTYTIDGAPRRREFKNEAHGIPEHI